MATRPPSVRLYGCTVGHGSFCRVTAGMQAGLTDLGAFAGLVPLDRYDEEQPYPGYDADIGVYVGPPDRVALMAGIGEHRQRWMLLAPNSSWVPSAILGRAWPYVTGFIAPSGWAAGVLGKATDAYGAPVRDYRRVSTWRHGVAAGFTRVSAAHEALSAAYERGKFEVLHMASSTAERKGTRELLQAWNTLVTRKALGERPLLRLVVDGQTDALQELVEGGAEETVVWKRGRLNLDVADTARLYRQHHVLCAPSRGEGFGLCPLEARASGIVVAATLTTGHSEHLRVGCSVHGVVPIVSGADAPIDDGPGALAPALASASVEKALLFAFEQWPHLAAAAMKEAPSVSYVWNWPHVTDDWLRSIL